MVDLFAVNDFVRFLRKEYPEINISVKYDPVFFELHIQIDCMKIDYNFRTVIAHVFDTKTAIDAISYHHIDFLACLSKKGVKLNAGND